MEEEEGRLKMQSRKICEPLKETWSARLVLGRMMLSLCYAKSVLKKYIYINLTSLGARMAFAHLKTHWQTVKCML